MPSFAVKTLLVSSLLLLQGISAAPVANADSLHSDTHPHWVSNTLTIPNGQIHKRGLAQSNPGQEIEGWLKEALRETPDLQLNPMYANDREMVEWVEELRKEVALEMKMEEARQGQKQKVVG